LISMGVNSNDFRVEGTLKQPFVRGSVILKGVDLDVPIFEPSTEKTNYPINPKFDIQIGTGDPANVRSSGARLRLTGSSYLSGSLMEPEMNSFATILSGTLRLPNSRIQIDEGGAIELKLTQLGQGNSIFEVPVRMTGRTNVTAKRQTGNYERYDVTLHMTGDLLKAGDFVIRGESDPQDLTQDEILAIIGQRELLESFVVAAGDTRSNQFRESIFGLAVPTLTDSFTSILSEQLKLDYISLDYNPFDQTTITAAKSFNKYLSLRAWRRIPLNNSLKDRYELRLVYRIPTNNSFLSRSRLALITGTNQRLRISFEISGRL